MRALLTAALVAALGLPACDAGEPEAPPPPDKSAPAERAERRLYDGAPPTVPHDPVGADCTECHNAEGREVAGLGFAPPSPHELTRGMSAMSRCRQCHVYAGTTDVFRANGFRGLEQDMRHGERLHPLAPPTLPHKAFMRENCIACHDGLAAREAIRVPHPWRTRCRQCHLDVTTTSTFSR